MTNPIFQEWPGTLPPGMVQYNVEGGAVSKETDIKRTGSNAVRVASNGTTTHGLTITSGGPAWVPNISTASAEYVVVECDFYSVTTSLSGAGILLDWYAPSSGSERVNISFPAEFGATVQANRWYSLRKVVKKPGAMAFGSFGAIIMTNWSDFGANSAKTLIVDRFVVREASAEERRTFNVADEISAAVSVESSARASAIGEVEAKYTVKVDTNGYISGFGLIGTANDATPSSEFFVLATRFKVAAPGVAPVAAFVVDAGNVYIDTAFIRNLTGENFAAETVLANKSIHVGSAANGAGVSLDGSTGTIVSRYANGTVAVRIGPNGSELVRLNKPNGTLALRATTTAFELGTDVVATAAMQPNAVTIGDSVFTAGRYPASGWMSENAWHTVQSINIAAGEGAVHVWCSARVIAVSGAEEANQYMDVRIRRASDNAIVFGPARMYDPVQFTPQVNFAFNFQVTQSGTYHMEFYPSDDDQLGFYVHDRSMHYIRMKR